MATPYVFLLITSRGQHEQRRIRRGAGGTRKIQTVVARGRGRGSGARGGGGPIVSGRGAFRSCFAAAVSPLPTGIGSGGATARAGVRGGAAGGKGREKALTCADWSFVQNAKVLDARCLRRASCSSRYRLWNSRDYFFDLLMLSPGASSFAFEAPVSFLTSPGAN
jgi:hypothetical protein